MEDVQHSLKLKKGLMYNATDDERGMPIEEYSKKAIRWVPSPSVQNEANYCLEETVAVRRKRAARAKGEVFENLFMTISQAHRALERFEPRFVLFRAVNNVPVELCAYALAI